MQQSPNTYATAPNPGMQQITPMQNVLMPQQQVAFEVNISDISQSYIDAWNLMGQ
jgi:hypothetical protein